jgi:hypothetical protein
MPPILEILLLVEERHPSAATVVNGNNVLCGIVAVTVVNGNNVLCGIVAARCRQERERE